LRDARFRVTWAAFLGAQVVIWAQTVGAVDVITEQSSSAALVALIQTAISLPGVVLALVAGAVALDFRTYRRVFADRGPWFGSYFSVVHILVTFVGALGGAIGTIQRFLLPRPAPPASHQLGRSAAR
jgi:branched-subunit amino acid permease